MRRPGSPAACSTDEAASLSFGEPTSHTCRPSATKRAARSAKCVGGHRFAGPYSAPGHSTATGGSVRRCIARIAAPRLATSGTSTGPGGVGTSAPGAAASAANRSTSRGRPLASSRRASFSRP